MNSKHYDAIVIGGGQGGSLAMAFGKAGRQTALVERRHLGGSCINWGCTPTKTMIAAAGVAHTVRRAGEYGVLLDEAPRVDLRAIRDRKRAVVREFRESYTANIEAAPNLEVLLGEASFRGPKEIEVVMQQGETRRLTAETIVIATGSCRAVPSVAGLDVVPWLDEEGAMELAEVPEHLVILGGGYIAVEFGQMFRRFGSQVTIIEQGSQLLAREDEDIATIVAGFFRDEGITVLLDTEAVAVKRRGDGVEVTIESDAGRRVVNGSHLLLAAGQKPATGLLHLRRTGVATDEKGYVQVNDQLETNVPGIYALGDVKGGPAFTHIAYDDMRILRDNLLHGASYGISRRLVPWVVFTDPQLGRVGISEKEAHEQDLNIRVATLPMKDTARGIETGQTRGLLKAIVDADTDLILGAALLAADGGEVMAVVQTAMRAEMPYTALRDGIFAHPTLSESLNNLFLKLDRETSQS